MSEATQPATFSIAFKLDGEILNSTPYPVPSHLPQAGEVYLVRRPFRTLAACAYFAGDELHIIERTQEAPYGRLNTLGNLKVRCKYFQESIWTNIEIFINDGTLQMVRSHSQPRTDEKALAPRVLVSVPSRTADHTMLVVVAPDGLGLDEAKSAAAQIIKAVKEANPHWFLEDIKAAFVAAGWEFWPHAFSSEAC